MGRVRATLAFAAAAAVAGCNSSNAVPQPAPPLHAIRHVIIMMQENRSFNTMFAGFPGATTAMSGPCEKTPWCKTGTAKLHSVTLESTNESGLGKDIDHSHHGFDVECNANSLGMCRNDGFDKIGFGQSGQEGPARLYPYAYVDRAETKPYWDFAKQYTLADEMFLTDTSSSFIAHQLILSGTVRLNARESLADQPDGTPWGCDAVSGTRTPVLFTNGRENFYGPFPCFTEYPTLADVLDAANVSWSFYVENWKKPYYDFSGGVWDGFDAIKKVRYGPDWKTHVIMPNTSIFGDLKNGTLPAMSWLIPRLDESDHPAAGCNHGPHWVTSVVDAVGESKYWDSTAIILLWDDWGGWYDPVPPAQINYTSLSFRVPLIVISPWARKNTVDHTMYQYGSILRFVEDNFGLASLHTTDETSTSLGNAFDFTQKPTPFVREPLPSWKPCPTDPDAQQIIDHDGGVPE